MPVAPLPSPLATVEVGVGIQRQEQRVRWTARQPNSPRQEGEEGGARAEVERAAGQPALAVGGPEEMLEVERRGNPAGEERRRRRCPERAAAKPERNAEEGTGSWVYDGGRRQHGTPGDAPAEVRARDVGPCEAH